MSRSEYTRRMNKVLDHIDQHLDRPLDLAALAEVAHFSPFHFHRLFAAWMGETLGEYLRRRRLEAGAVRLAGNHSVAVLEVAVAVGFASGEAFARAFKLHFGCSPSAWRAQTPERWTQQLNTARASRNPDQALSNRSQVRDAAGMEHGGSPTALAEITMQVTLKQLRATEVAYLRHIGPYGPAVGAFWKSTFIPWLHAQGLAGRAQYGIGHDDPSVTTPDKCRYDTCVEVPAGFVASEPAGKHTLPGGRYAVLAFEGTPADIGAAWTELLRTWLPASGLQIDARPCFEYYPVDARYDAKTGAFSCELCLPVAPL